LQSSLKVLIYRPKQDMHLRKLAETMTYLVRWAIGFAFFFALAALVIIGVLFYRPAQLYVLVQPLCRLALRAVGVRVKVHGLERFDHRRTFLIISNHESLLDAFICPAYIPMYFTTLELAEHFNWPLWGWVIRRWGHIPLQKGNLSESLKSLQQAATLLSTGRSILIFPEGGRTVTGNLQVFKKGAFHLAQEARADILPIAINGLYRAKTRGDWRFRSANVSLNFGYPLLYETYRNDTTDDLRDRCFESVSRLKNEAPPSFPS